MAKETSIPGDPEPKYAAIAKPFLISEITVDGDSFDADSFMVGISCLLIFTDM